jgi:hypothetical protein
MICKASPTTAIIDSQSVKSIQKGELGSILQAAMRAKSVARLACRVKALRASASCLFPRIHVIRDARGNSDALMDLTASTKLGPCLRGK